MSAVSSARNGNGQARPAGPAAYAPTNADPVRLATVTIDSLDRIGTRTAEEIDKTADDIMKGATHIAETLRALATAIHGHVDEAREHVEAFCNKATSVFEGVCSLRERLDPKREEQTASENTVSDTLAVPDFLQRQDAAR